jgi:mannose-1-phosphate guanylyltransferase
MPSYSSAEDLGRTGTSHDCRESGQRWGVILAGGEGKRLLPLTRQITGDDRPKQFCRVLGNETLLRQTLRRVVEIVSPSRILFILTEAHEPFYVDELGEFDTSSLLIQRYNRGTAPAILYGLARIHHSDPKGLVAFFPSDHYIGENSVLRGHIDSAFRQADSDPETVILLGMSPDSPEVGYGWIQPGAPLTRAVADSIFHVVRFWEKPSQFLASQLMNSGCLWNSFIMVGRVRAFLKLIRGATPVLFRSFHAVLSGLRGLNRALVDHLYSRIPAVNFSQEVLSTRPNALAVVRADGLEWSDLGEPGRVLSIVARKGIAKEWNFDPCAEAPAAAGMSA